MPTGLRLSVHAKVIGTRWRLLRRATRLFIDAHAIAPRASARIGRELGQRRGACRQFCERHCDFRGPVSSRPAARVGRNTGQIQWIRGRCVVVP